MQTLNLFPILLVWTLLGFIITSLVFGLGALVGKVTAGHFGNFFFTLGVIAGGPLMWAFLYGIKSQDR